MAKAKRLFSLYDNFEFPDYEFKEYPKILYSSPDGQTLRTVTVNSPSEERALPKAGGWSKTPDEARAAGEVYAAANPAQATQDAASIALAEREAALAAREAELAEREALLKAPAKPPAPPVK